MNANLMLVCLLLTFGVFACQPNTSTETEQSQETTEVDLATEEAAIKAVTQKQSTAYFQRNYEHEAEAWAQTPYILRINGPTGNRMMSWDSIGTSYKTAFGRDTWWPDDARTTCSNYDIHINGNSAWAVYDQLLEWTNQEGEKRTAESYQVRFLEKIDGQWRIVFQLNNPYPAEEEG